MLAHGCIQFVMAGLDPAIQARIITQRALRIKAGFWMRGSSPRMTVEMNALHTPNMFKVSNRA
jgi:hypothetical protein